MTMTRCCARDPFTGKRCKLRAGGTWCEMHLAQVERGRAKAEAAAREGDGQEPKLRPLEGLSRVLTALPPLLEMQAKPVGLRIIG